MSNDKKNKTKSRIRETLICALVALVFSPKGIFVGFHLNDYLARDNLNIIGIELIPETEELLFQDEYILSLKRSWLYEIFEKKDILSNGSILSLVIEKEQSLTKYNIEAFLNQITILESYTKEIDSKLKLALDYFENYKPNLQPPEDLRFLSNISTFSFLFPEKIQDDSVRDNIVNKIKSMFPDIEEILLRIKGLQSESKDYRFPRTGRLRIKVIIVNKGNTDGLVSGAGELVMIDKDKTTIKISAYRRIPDETGSKKVYFESVPKRSITILELFVDEERTSLNELTSLKDALKNNNPDRVLVKLVDSHNRSFQSKAKTLPVKANEY